MAVARAELLITIPSDETASKDSDSVATKQRTPHSHVNEPNTGGFAKSGSVNDHTLQEISGFSPTAVKPPKIPVSNENQLTRRRTLARSAYSKPKSRFGEQPLVVDDSILEEESLVIEEHISRNSSYRHSLTSGSPDNRPPALRTNSIIQRITSMASSRRHTDGDEDDVEDVVKKVESIKQKNKRVGAKVVRQWILFACLSGFLVASLTVDKLEKTMIWELELWKWCVLVLVIFSGMLITNWFMHFVVFVIERNFLLQKKVLYFVHGLKNSVQVFIWICLVLLAWQLLFDDEDHRSKTATKILKGVTWTLAALLIGSFLWVAKSLSLKILASNFHVKTFFDRIHESIFHQYVLQTLSRPPSIEEAERVGKSGSAGQLSFRSNKTCKTKETKVIDMGMLHKMKREKVSAGTMKILVDACTNSGLCTLSNTLDQCVCGGNKQTDTEIHNEMEATAAAYYIFRNVAKPDSKYIVEEDLLRFMIKEEVDLVFPMFEVSENGQIDRKSLTNWVIKVYNGRKALAHALVDTKTAVNQLNKLLTSVLIVATIAIWVLMMELASTKVLMFILSQLLVASFIMKNTLKTIFEALIFVFITHPFDVGDRCVVDGLPLLVEEMNILTTVFLKLDNEKVYYPNAVLATKPISNFYRSPDMGDAIEFSIDFGTPVEKIGLLKDRIKQYLENNPNHWYPGHGFVVKAIENVNKLKMALYCTHTLNFQEWPEKTKRRSELLLDIKKMLEELEIKYHLPPQPVYLRHIQSESTIMTKI